MQQEYRNLCMLEHGADAATQDFLLLRPSGVAAFADQLTQ
jgi:hypothetical protein